MMISDLTRRLATTLRSIRRPDAVVRDQLLRIPVAGRDAGGGDVFVVLFLLCYGVVEVEELFEQILLRAEAVGVKLKGLDCSATSL